MSLQKKLDEAYPFSFDFKLDRKSSLPDLLNQYFLYNYNREKRVFEIYELKEEKAYEKDKTFYQELMKQGVIIRSATEAELGTGVLGQYDPRSNTILLLYSLAADQMRTTREHELRHYDRTVNGMRNYDRGKEEHETRRETNTLEPGYA
ncbi:hypothetical protein HYT57_03995 [Candidatus Woesearchaeota archaeon]|nr:hypothetical protein [Candidatus Woesearchaeota archaeon]